MTPITIDIDGVIEHAEPLLAALAGADRRGVILNFLNARGGVVSEVLKVAERVAQITDSTGIVVRICASAAVALLSACRERFAFVGAHFEFHCAFEDDTGLGPVQRAALAADLRRTDRRFRQFVGSQTGVDIEVLRHLDETEATIYAHAARRLRLIDEVYA